MCEETLLAETLRVIERSGHAVSDIVFIGSEESGHSCSWDEFCVLADVEYNHGYGTQQVAMDLIIVFSDGQRLWRDSADGKEWWNYCVPFEIPTELKPIESLFALIGGESIERIERKTKEFDELGLLEVRGIRSVLKGYRQ